MRLTKTTSHAIRILVDCAAAEGKLLKTAEISERLEITPLNVFKIVNILSHAGFIEAIRGRNGGVRLSRPASEIRIGEVVRSIEATAVEVEATAKRSRSAKPQINAIFDDAMEAFIFVLDQHTLADMVDQRLRRGAKRRVRTSAAALPRALLVRS